MKGGPGGGLKFQLVLKGEVVLKGLLKAVIGFFTRLFDTSLSPKHCSHSE